MKAHASRASVEELLILKTTYARLRENETVYVDQIPRTKRALRRVGHTPRQIQDLEKALKTAFPEK